MIRLARRLALAAALCAAFGVHAAAAPTASEADKRFDLSVNNAPAAQVFMQMAANTPYNVLVSPEVSGNVSITLKSVTLTEALDSMRDLFGYDYQVTGNRILVQPNTVQTRLFRVSYLPGRRQGASDLRVSSSAITQTNTNQTNGSTGSSTSSTGSTGSSQTRQDDSAHVRTTSDADFWREVNTSLNALVGGEGGRSVVLNPSAGVIVVRARPAELRQVEQYLKAVQLSIERQVMIEAKIVEVQLSKDAQAGVNWAGFGRVFDNVRGAIGLGAPGTTLQTSGPLTSGDSTVVIGNGSSGSGIQNGSVGRGFYGLALQASNFAALINFLQTQGDVEVLSSPRIATLNNQKAVLKVGTDELFVTGVTSNTTTSGTGTVSTPTLNLTPFFSGIVLDVTPQIDEDGQVMLHVHPAISTVAEKQKNVDLGSLGSFRLPLATSTVNETDSIVRVRDGQFVAIGGLMVQATNDSHTGVPGLAEAPIVGGLFRQTSKVSSKHELVILMKPTVIREDGAWPEANLPPTAAGERK